MIFEKNVLLTKRFVFAELFPLFKGPGRAHMGPYGPLWALMGPYGPEKSQKTHKEIAFIGAFKGSCTLPRATV